MSKSIVDKPYEFACQWYDVDDIHRCITSKLNPVFGGTVDIPKDTTSREFAEWLAGEYRLAMRKGAELAIAELRDRQLPDPLAMEGILRDQQSQHY